MSGYQELYDQSVSDKEGFWLDIARDIHWDTFPSIALDGSDAPFFRWFPDGQTNACYNAVDLHVENGRGEQAAIIYDSAVTDQSASITYSELQQRVAKVAGMLAAQGVVAGDRVIVYMPMIPEAAIAMLACARIGAVHSVVFGGFAAKELAVRIDDCEPKVILAGSCGMEPGRIVEYKPLLDQAIELASHKPSHCFVWQRKEAIASLVPGRDSDWQQTEAESAPVDCVSVNANHPLYILYTSGTTGAPKGVVRDTGGSIVSLKWTMKNIYDVNPGDVYWAASDVGWVVGHSYIVYAPLFHGNTTVLYEGKPVGTPDPGAFWRVISEHKVSVLFTAPTAFRAIKKEDPKGEYLKSYDMSSLRYLFLAGERCDPDTLDWAQKKLNVPVIDHWWQTETGWSICTNCAGVELLPIKPGSPTKPAPGYHLKAVDTNGAECKPGDIGALVIESPLPPGTFPTLWNAPDRYKESYFTNYPGHYETGDAGYIDSDGYAYVMSRTDDVINIAGHRLSTGAMEEVLADHPDVAECAVIGVADSLKGQVPLGMLVLNSGCDRSEQDICTEVVSKVRSEIGPVAAFKSATVVKRLPKTRSGKILRATMRAIADGAEWAMPATIDDPVILDEITDSLSHIGYPRSS